MHMIIVVDIWVFELLCMHIICMAYLAVYFIVAHLLQSMRINQYLKIICITMITQEIYKSCILYSYTLYKSPYLYITIQYCYTVTMIYTHLCIYTYIHNCLITIMHIKFINVPGPTKIDQVGT